MNFHVLRNAIFLLVVLSFVLAQKKNNHDKKALHIVPVLPILSTNADPVQHIGHVCSPQEPLKPIQHIYCAVESGMWNVSYIEASNKTVGCLLGGTHRCQTVAAVPTAKEILPSKPPPESPDALYNRLVAIAEKAVPETWWRQGFDNEKLQLTNNSQDLPRQQLSMHHPLNAKLHNIYRCVTRQTFIRTPFSGSSEPDDVSCSSADPNFSEFYALWQAHHTTLGGSDPDAKSALLQSATEVLHLFLELHGKSNCETLQKKIACRGALAAAAQVCSAHFLTAVVGHRRSFTESKLIRGYMLASLGRGLLHGDNSTTGNVLITAYPVQLNDFTTLQQAYLTLYTESYGAVYTAQLTKHIPLAFAPNFTVHVKEPRWTKYAHKLEPVYTSMRNWMFHEAGAIIDFGPYIPLVAFPEVRAVLQAKSQIQRVLIDIGANGFFASPKYLIDSYAMHLPFTHAVMVDPEPSFPATVPKSYSDRYNITFLPLYAEIGTDTESDVLKLLPALVKKEDFVVLKFDVDPNKFAHGCTMEWGLLFSLMQHPEVATLIDELYIELHFFLPMLNWVHYHSNWEALDTIRYLRQQGMIVHAWP
uniref:Uncharacterized protein n=1 Tax=Spumella elongata TaxID=89044 RepID=A0A7S3H6L9_9STRA